MFELAGLTTFDPELGTRSVESIGQAAWVVERFPAEISVYVIAIIEDPAARGGNATSGCDIVIRVLQHDGDRVVFDGGITAPNLEPPDTDAPITSSFGFGLPITVDAEGLYSVEATLQTVTGSVEQVTRRFVAVARST